MLVCKSIFVDLSTLKLFSVSQAEEVITFINLIKDAEEDAVLVVHCDAGVSRSGAVGTFVCDYLGLDYNEFMSENKGIMPNPYVLKLLRETAGMNSYSFGTLIDPE